MDVMKGTNIMSGGILDSFQTIIPTAAAVLSERRQMLRMTQQEVADRANLGKEIFLLPLLVWPVG